MASSTLRNPSFGFIFNSYICSGTKFLHLKSESGNVAFWKDLHLLETLRGGGVYLIVKIVGSLGAYFFAWYVSRNYGAEGNGIFAFTLTSAVLLAAFFNLGLNTYIVKVIPAFKAENNAEGVRGFYRKALMTIVGVTLTGCGLLVLISVFVPHAPFSTEVLLIGVATIPVSILLFLSHTFKAQKRILGYSLLQNNVVQVLALLVLLLPLWPIASVSEPVWAFVVAGVTLCIAGWFFNQSGTRALARITDIPFRSHLRESLPMLAGGLAYMVLNLSDRMMLRFLDTTTQLGIYDVALRLSNLTLLGILSLNAVAEPKFAEFFAQNDPVRLRRYAGRMTWIGMGISIPVIGLLGLFPDTWMGLFGTGADFLPGISSLYILLIGQIVSVGCGAVLVMLNMTGQQRSVQTILLTSALLNILLNLLLIPSMGIDGAAWATAFSTLVWNVWGVWTIRTKLGFWMWGFRG